MSRSGAKYEDTGLPTPYEIQGRCLEKHEGKLKDRGLRWLWSVRICYLFGEEKDCNQVEVKRGTVGVWISVKGHRDANKYNKLVNFTHL